MHGRNKIGLTATINSVSRLGFDELAGGTLQIEVDPLFLRLEDPASFIESIANSYFQKSGNQIFVNIVSRDTLIDAMEHPEEHEDLVIRVTGYSVHFVQLDKAIQQEIVARTRYS
ncbi:MAG: hypothetical protein M1371_09950 [Actinobacteria bacterium]|nr:hypothetical protein [Actinomycetota bacterium]